MGVSEFHEARMSLSLAYLKKKNKCPRLPNPMFLCREYRSSFPKKKRLQTDLMQLLGK